MALISWSDFMNVEIRTGTIVAADNFPEAKNPAYKLTVDFGDFGLRKTSAQITALYSTDELIGMQIVAVVNFPVKQIANFFSESLILGVIGENEEVTLLTTERKVLNGLRIG